MARQIEAKKYIIEERNRMMYELEKKGFSRADIARLFNINRSIVTNVLGAEKKATAGELSE